MPARECPMCGETMRLGDRETTDRIAGTSHVQTRAFREWTCPECDYFEDADENTPEDVAATAGSDSAGAERQQQILADGVVQFIQVERRLALVAQHLEHGWTSFFGNLDAGILRPDDVHLQRLYEKILVIPATGTSQRHARLLFRRQSWLPKG